jgi:hypothetical protein
VGSTSQELCSPKGCVARSIAVDFFVPWGLGTLGVRDKKALGPWGRCAIGGKFHRYGAADSPRCARDDGDLDFLCRSTSRHDRAGALFCIGFRHWLVVQHTRGSVGSRLRRCAASKGDTRGASSKQHVPAHRIKSAHD